MLKTSRYSFANMPPEHSPEPKGITSRFEKLLADLAPAGIDFAVVSFLLAGISACAAPTSAWPIKDKTLVAWVQPANVTQRGGSVITLGKAGGAFDAMVFAELTPATWMPGSDHFRRTKKEQQDFPKEASTGTEWVQIAIVYKDQQITLYRNGRESGTYAAASAEAFPRDTWVLLGLRHLEAAPENRFFFGSIDDARIYNVALTPDQIAMLKANQPSPVPPIAWWDFEKGVATDRMKTFPVSTLVGGARLTEGRLHLEQPGGYLLTRMDHDRTPRADDANVSARAVREKLLTDPHRPGYHFVIPEGTGMPFDPNGAIFWKGRYHLFYIFQDKRGHNWGHVSSSDLFHWRHHPTGLITGMFSGNAFVNKDGRPTICYHQVDHGNAMAVALDDDLNEWKKLDVITPRTKPGDPHHGKYRSWDPYGWLENDSYYAIFGGERPGLAKAPRLDGEWKYVGDFLANTVPGVSINEDVSCADFFKLGNRHMLLCISHRLGARYYLGDWKNEQFHPDYHQQMSWVDNSFFAPESLLDNRGRRIMWAWIFDSAGFKMRTDYGWSGTMSLPRVLSLGADGRLRMEPPEEIERLRFGGKRKNNLTLKADTELTLDGVLGNSLELDLDIDAPNAQQCGVKVCCSPGGEEETLIFYDAAEKKLKVDTTRSSPHGPKTIEAGPFELAAGERLRLRLFVDRSVVEVFANGRQAVMRRIYPSRPDSLGVKVFARGGPASVRSLEAWEIAPANPY